jgi:DNA helicase-2/ATP-dependent DNA helicase PcrA
MRERVEELIGGSARMMWVTTFHSACARMLRVDAERLGYSRSFTIYDESDSVRMVKRAMEELEVDSKRYPARAIKNRISGAKNELVDSVTYSERIGSDFERAEVYCSIEAHAEANAMDFDDPLSAWSTCSSESSRERWRAFVTCWSTSTRTPTTPNTASSSC